MIHSDIDLTELLDFKKDKVVENASSNTPECRRNKLPWDIKPRKYMRSINLKNGIQDTKQSSTDYKPSYNAQCQRALYSTTSSPYTTSNTNTVWYQSSNYTIEYFSIDTTTDGMTRHTYTATDLTSYQPDYVYTTSNVDMSSINWYDYINEYYSIDPNAMFSLEVSYTDKPVDTAYMTYCSTCKRYHLGKCHKYRNLMVSSKDFGRYSYHRSDSYNRNSGIDLIKGKERKKPILSRSARSASLQNLSNRDLLIQGSLSDKIPWLKKLKERNRYAYESYIEDLLDTNRDLEYLSSNWYRPNRG